MGFQIIIIRKEEIELKVREVSEADLINNPNMGLQTLEKGR